MNKKKGNIVLYADIEFNGKIVKVFRNVSVSKKAAKKFLDQYVDGIKNGEPTKVNTEHMDFIIIEKERITAGYKTTEVEPSKITYLRNVKLDENAIEMPPTPIIGNFDPDKLTLKYEHNFYITQTDNE